jgi:hypothetical protein
VHLVFPLAASLDCLVGGKLSPIPLYKGPPWRKVEHMWIEGAPWKSSTLPLMRLPSPLSLSCGSPKGCIGAKSNTPLHAVMLGEFRIQSKTDLLPQSRLDWRGRKKSSFAVCVRVLEGVALVASGHCVGIVAPVLWLQDLHDLEVDYIDFIINTCPGAQSPRSVYEGMSPISRNCYIITPR